jgi:hypothetical protein
MTHCESANGRVFRQDLQKKISKSGLEVAPSAMRQISRGKGFGASGNGARKEGARGALAGKIGAMPKRRPQTCFLGKAIYRIDVQPIGIIMGNPFFSSSNTPVESGTVLVPFQSPKVPKSTVFRSLLSLRNESQIRYF